MSRFRCVDLFCGGGGTSTGMIEAFRKAGDECSLVGINHWQVAIDTNRRNHDGKWLCASVDAVDPTDVVPEGVLDFLWASPECTNHSRAKGGKPRSNQSRCQPEMLLSWIRKLIVKRMYVENVPDFLEWGPLLAADTWIAGKLHRAGQPDPRRKGVLFRDWIESIRRSGYRVEWRLLNAADYGAATSRERLIVQAVRIGTGEKIAWPEPTHSRLPDMFISQKWTPARDIIDWSIKGESIFRRRHPLAENTLRRIENGIRRYWGQWAEPFLVKLRGTRERQLAASAYPLSEPLPTISAGGGHLGLVEPFLVSYHGGSGGERRNSPLSEPVPTCDCANRYGMVSPLFIPQQSAGTAKPTETCPLPTISTAGAIGLVEPLIVPYHGTEVCAGSVGVPLGTITTRDRFALVEGECMRLDITFRMLQPHELAAAMSFPSTYRFSGTKTEQIRQIGNAVCPKLAEALVSAALSA